MKKWNHLWMIGAVLCVAVALLLLLGRHEAAPSQVPGPSASHSVESGTEQGSPAQESAAPSPQETAPAESPVSSPEQSVQPMPSRPAEASSVPGKETPSLVSPKVTPKATPGAVSSLPSEKPSAAPTPTAAPASSAVPAVSVCTLTVRCDTLAARRESLAPEVREIVPENGIVLQTVSLTPNEGETVFSLLKRAAQDQKLHLEFQMTPGTGGVYVEGIGNLYEFDGGALSGWLYRVNGVFYPESASDHCLSPGDRVEWIYTCDLGRDVGAPSLK